MSGKKQPRGRTRRADKEQTCSIQVQVPMLMRQAIRDREKLSNQPATTVVLNILLTALRVEMEMVKRESENKGPGVSRGFRGEAPGSQFRKVEGA